MTKAKKREVEHAYKKIANTIKIITKDLPIEKRPAIALLNQHLDYLWVLIQKI